MNDDHKQKKLILCSTCWGKSDHKNPPIMGELLEGGNVLIRREGINVVVSGERFSILCNECQIVLYEKFEKEEIVEFEEQKMKIKRFFFSGEILGGTV